jgi:hypothetical protein
MLNPKSMKNTQEAVTQETRRQNAGGEKKTRHVNKDEARMGAS